METEILKNATYWFAPPGLFSLLSYSMTLPPVGWVLPFQSKTCLQNYVIVLLLTDDPSLFYLTTTTTKLTT